MYLLNKLFQNNGFTYNPFTGEEPTSGFMVSDCKDCETVFELSQINDETITKYMVDHAQQLGRVGAFLGAWVDSGKVYFDISMRFENKNEALTVARDNAQLAIFDLGNFQVIPA